MPGSSAGGGARRSSAGECLGEIGPGEHELEAVLAIDGEHRDAVRLAHEKVVIGGDVDRVPAIGAKHLVKQDAGVLAEVASLSDVEHGTRHGGDHTVGSVRRRPRSSVDRAPPS